jgi:WXG100 family type VII secretion target
MTLGINISVEDLEALASRIQQEAGSLESTLASMRQQCTREASFSGSAANKYDEFLTKWDSNQRALLEDIRGAGNVLANLANTTRANNDSVAATFG